MIHQVKADEVKALTEIWQPPPMPMPLIDMAVVDAAAAEALVAVGAMLMVPISISSVRLGF